MKKNEKLNENLDKKIQLNIKKNNIFEEIRNSCLLNQMKFEFVPFFFPVKRCNSKLKS